MSRRQCVRQPAKAMPGRPLCAALGLALVLLPLPLLAQEDGIRLEDRNASIRKIVPLEDIERQAAQEYEQIKQEAVAQRTLMPDNNPQLIRLRAIARRLLPETVRWNERARQWNWEVNLINTRQVNAFCMPGGKIAFYAGLLDRLKLTDDEVAMAMGHEIAHALREHARERAAQSEITNLGANVISQLFGFGNLGNMALGTGAHLLTLRFSRADETEADLVGMDIAARAGYDPRSSVSLWQKMGTVTQSQAGAEFLSTHPSGRSRIAELEKHMPEVLPLYVQARNMTMSELPPYQANMKNLGDAPVDSGDEDKQRPLKK
ncbi:peptidase M48 [Cupriavidus sp. USMAA2-4]|uniref:Peptidase M48 n=1 Tax=Cupriavidus malaysiensis TaxID=367825 RepID=A0A1D9HYY2_9BURK|nr:MULTISPECIES: M48 family metallopeptidase [Cupriavidus]AOY91996.1 peptidase M48 [Cupriavidus sp. USMAA2-4]AOY98445.1 peptidase M48 [Cupriavidus sp. USMAHM13]AOZ04875.1 peptidase M48 [Cupriavidus malaysiensis]